MAGNDNEYTGISEEQKRALAAQHEEDEQRAEIKRKANEKARKTRMSRKVRKTKKTDTKPTNGKQTSENKTTKRQPISSLRAKNARNKRLNNGASPKKADNLQTKASTPMDNSKNESNIQDLVNQIKAGKKPQPKTEQNAATIPNTEGHTQDTEKSSRESLNRLGKEHNIGHNIPQTSLGAKTEQANIPGISSGLQNISTNGTRTNMNNGADYLPEDDSNTDSTIGSQSASPRGDNELQLQAKPGKVDPKSNENNSNVSENPNNQDDLKDMPDIEFDLGGANGTERTQNNGRKTRTTTDTPVAETATAIFTANEIAKNRANAQTTVDKLERATNTAATMGRAANNVTKGVARKAAGSLAGKAAKSGSKSLMKSAKSLSFLGKLGLIGTAVWAFIFILMVIGALAFFMNMPAMVLDNMKSWTMDAYDAIKGYINKQVSGVDLPTEKEVKQLAADMNAMNTDLVYWGFASEFSIDSRTNRVDTLKSKYLPVYLAAEQRNYMVANKFENVSIASAFKAIKDIFSGAENVTWGTGLLYIEEDAATLLKIQETSEGSAKTTIENKVSVDRRGKEMIINRNGWDSWFSTKGVEVYRFKLKYWLEKYATPLDFYLALHTSTGAPEFVYQMATNPSQGDGVVDKGSGNILTTRISINIAALEPGKDYDMEIVYLDIDPKTKKVRIGDDGLPQTLTVREVRAKLAAGEEVVGLTNNPAANDILERAEKFDASNLIAYTPYITNVVNHWYYKEVVYQGTPQSGTHLSPVNVYAVEDFSDNKPRVRYQMYESIQVPGANGTINGGSNGSSSADPNGGNSSGNSGENGSSNNGSSEGNSGSTGNNGSSNGETNYKPNEQGTGDDRKQLAESTQIAEDSGISSGGFFGSILDLINSISGWVGSWGGITGMIFDLPSQILNNSYSSLAGLINGVMPSSLISNISNGWLRGLGYYAMGNIPGLNNLNYGLIGNTLGINKLQYALSADNLMNQLGLGEVRGTLMNIANLTDINQIPAHVANALDVPELTGTFYGVSNMVQNGITSDSLVNTMYSGLSTQMKDELSQQVLNYSRMAFNGVSSGDAPTIAAGLIGGLATDLVDRTTGEFFNNLQGAITEQLDGQFNVQVEQLLQNENSKQLTGLTINELESMSKINNLDFKQIKEVNEDITKIQESVNESTTASRELSDIVNKISEDYAGIDAVTLCTIAKNIRDTFTELDNATKQLDSFEALFKNYSVDERTELQITTNIERARTAITSARESIEALEVENTRTYGKDLSTAGSEIARIIDTNKDKINPVTAAILMAQGNATSQILTTSGDKVERIDVNTITKFKSSHKEITLEGFLDTADKLAMIDPSLNGLTDEIEKLGNELKDVNKENVDGVLNKLEQYENNIEQIDWLTKSEKSKIKNQVSTLRGRVNNVNRNIATSNLALINTLAGSVTGITTYRINAFANQILNFPNNTIMSLLNSVRQIPRDLVNQVSRTFTEKVAEAITSETKKQLAQKVEEGLSESLNGEGQLNAAIQTRTSNSKGDMSEEEQPLEGSQTEILTGFYIKETRYRDYMQKSEPILVPYSFEHWKKLFIDNKYILTGDYGQAYNTLMQELSDAEKETLLENETFINQYGKSIWEGTGGNLEETIYAQLQSMPSVDSQYLIRYFKELFATYGDELRSEAAKQNLKSVNNVKYPIGWIFRTSKVTEIINTNTGETRIVDKAEYAPVTWTNNNAGTLYSTKNDPVYGFKPDIDIVSPCEATVISKTEAKVNEVGEKVLPTITLQVKSSDNNINGMRVIIKGGNFSQATVGSTVSKDQVIGTTTTDDIMILVLAKGSHAQVDDISRYVYPPINSVNN